MAIFSHKILVGRPFQAGPKNNKFNSLFAAIRKVSNIPS